MPRIRAGIATSPDARRPGPGISRRLARERTRTIGSVRYDLTFIIPSGPRNPVQGRVTVRFTLQAPHPVVLDFARPHGRVRSVRAPGGADLPFTIDNGHLVIPAEATSVGDNALDIEFIAGQGPLNRGREFLYTLFVPAHAHQAFPCFDQPDLKARTRLTLEVPAQWQAVANGAVASTDTHSGRTRVQFAETEPIPTYLIAFVAGRFSVASAQRGGRDLRLYHRETDRAKVARNLDAIFDLHAEALAWLEEYTGIAYPFGKFDVVAIPSFQFSGMEHPGVVLYNAGAVLLDESATQEQALDRASLIAHETAHMWFGNLVTMPWFDDVWLKEVMANIMAAKIANPSFSRVNHDLRFLLHHYPPAYQVDRTAGANPIRQSLANLNEAGQLYGPIIYRKSPVVMDQLEMILGGDSFRDGLREYLHTHAFGNADWNDLLRVLDARSPDDLSSWSRAWIEERGRPRFDVQIKVDDGRVSELTLLASDPLGRGVVWPQRLRVALGTGGDVRHVDVPVTESETRVREAEGLGRPAFVLGNGGGLGYGLFVLDQASRDFLLAHIEDVKDPVTRAAAWIALWDNMLERVVAPEAFLDTALRAAPVEADGQILQRLLAWTTRTFWRHVSGETRTMRSPTIEMTLRRGIEGAGTASARDAWFAAYRDVAWTPPAVEWIERLWSRRGTIPGLALSESDDINLAADLAIRGVPAAGNILATQISRIGNPDRRARFEFMIPALSPDPALREGAFDRLKRRRNRRREPWVIESLMYLNHPLREAHALRFVASSLALLPEIQRTGDIFFPARWVEASLGGHRSPEAAAVVRDFLSEHSPRSRRLRWIILAAADELFRAADTHAAENRAR